VIESYEEINRVHRGQRSRLTRAVNAGDPQRIVKVCEEAFAVFDTYAHGWPDDWSRWQRAKEDAEYTIRVKEWAR
jgi:hypothetical protein